MRWGLGEKVGVVFSFAVLVKPTESHTPGVYTRYPFDLSTRPSVLDLAFASTPLAPFISSWDVSLPSTGSDHLPILIKLSTPHLGPAPPSPDWAKTDWNTLAPLLKSLVIPLPPAYPNDATVDTWLDTHLSSLTTLLKVHTPRKRPTPRSKPWWSKELTHLRQNFHRTARAHRRDPSPTSLTDARTFKWHYFKAIQKVKAEHWKTFLSRVDTKTVWTAKRLAEGRDSD